MWIFGSIKSFHMYCLFLFWASFSVINKGKKKKHEGKYIRKRKVREKGKWRILKWKVSYRIFIFKKANKWKYLLKNKNMVCKGDISKLGHWGTWFTGCFDTAGLKVELSDLKGLFQPKWSHDSVIVFTALGFILTLTKHPLILFMEAESKIHRSYLLLTSWRWDIHPRWSNCSSDEPSSQSSS